MTQRTIPAVLDRIADQFSDHDALITDDRRLTFAELRTEVRRAAAAMIDMGVSAGDRVAIWSPNTWHWVVACLATHYAGGVVVPLNTRYTAGEATDILARTGAPLLVAMGEFLGADKTAELDRDALPALRHIVRVPIDKDDGTWDEFVARGTEPRRRGRPRRGGQARRRLRHPVHLRHHRPQQGRTVRAPAVAGRARGVGGVRAGHQRRPLPVHQPVLPQLRLQGRHPGLPADRGDADPAADVRPRAGDARGGQEHRITVLPGPPTIYQTLLDHPKRGDYDLTSLRFAVTGAATIPVVLIERMQSELDIDIVLTAYGLTEASGFGTMCRADDDAVTVATTCGRPIADFELRIDKPADDGPARCCCAGRT